MGSKIADRPSLAVSLSAVACAMALTLTMSVPQSSSAAPSNAAIDEAVAAREAWGLKAKRSHVAGLLQQAVSPVSKDNGFPMTATEAADIAKRADWADRVARKAMPEL